MENGHHSVIVVSEGNVSSQNGWNAFIGDISNPDFYENVCLKILKSVKSLATNTNEFKLVVVCRYASQHQAFCKSLWSGLKTVSIEYPSSSIQLYIVDEEKSVEDIQSLLASNSDSRLLKYVDGADHRESSIRDVSIADENEANPFGEISKVVITGGLGGIGKTLTQYLNKHYSHLDIVLTGRRKHTREISDELNSISMSSENRVTYVSVDISNYDEMDHKLSAFLGPNTLIVHAAGVIRDGFLKNKDISEMHDVFAPKVLGAHNLLRIISKYDVYKLALFSSISSINGNEGQYDYALANSYMDAIARSQYGPLAKKVVSINWPLWETDGMDVPDALKERLREKTGIVPIPANLGCKSFIAIISMDKTNVVVAFGNRFKIVETINYNSDVNEYAAHGITASLADVTAIIGGILKLDPNELKAGSSLSHYGFDSVLMLELKDLIESRYRVSMSTVELMEIESINSLLELIVSKTSDTDAVHEEDSYRSNAEHSGLVLVDKKWTSKNNNQSSTASENRVAIIGYSSLIGNIKTEDEFIALLENSGKAYSVQARWDETELPGNQYLNLIEDYDNFNYSYFGYTGSQAKKTDPQEKLTLVEVIRALNLAGYNSKNFVTNGNRVGVYVGVTHGTFNSHSEIGERVVSFSSIANRISYFLNANGPSKAIDTMCSSSSVALEEAFSGIKHNNIDSAVVCGVNMYLHPSKLAEEGEFGLISSTGANQSLSDNADGYIPCESTGALILKRLDLALAEGDNVLGVVDAVSVSHSGRTPSYYSMKSSSIQHSMKEVLRIGNSDLEDVSYVEAQLSGNKLTDAIELNAISEVWKEHGYIKIGTLKPNIGHAESGSGITQIAKVLEQIRNSKIYATIKPDVENEYLEKYKDVKPVYATQTYSWHNRKALINNFGAGGTVSSILISNLSEKHQHQIGDVKPYYIIPISGISIGHVKRQVDDVRLSLRNGDDIGSIERLLIKGREPLETRICIIADSAVSLLGRLDEMLNNGIEHGDLITSPNVDIDNTITYRIKKWLERSANEISVEVSPTLNDVSLGCERVPTLDKAIHKIEDAKSDVISLIGPALRLQMLPLLQSIILKNYNAVVISNEKQDLASIISNESANVASLLQSMGLMSKESRLVDFDLSMLDIKSKNIKDDNIQSRLEMVSRAVPGLEHLIVKFDSYFNHYFRGTSSTFDRSSCVVGYPKTMLDVGIADVINKLIQLAGDKYKTLVDLTFSNYSHLESIQANNLDIKVVSPTSQNQDLFNELMTKFGISSVAMVASENVQGDIVLIRDDLLRSEEYRNEVRRLIDHSKVIVAIKNPDRELLAVFMDEYDEYRIRLDAEHDIELSIYKETFSTEGITIYERQKDAFEILDDLFYEQFGLGLELEKYFDEYGTTSIGIALLLKNIEDKLGVYVDPIDFASFSKVKDIVSYIDKKMGVGLNDEGYGESIQRDFLANKAVLTDDIVDHKFSRQLYTTNNGSTIEFIKEGNGDPIVLLTALAFKSDVWSNQIKEFSKTNTVIAPNLPGHGASTVSDYVFSFEMIADQLKDLLDSQNIKNFVLVGWCMAGNIAQVFAKKYPNYIKHLALVCTTPTDVRMRGLTQEDIKFYSVDPLQTYEVELRNIYADKFGDPASKRDLRSILAGHCEMDMHYVTSYIKELISFNSVSYLSQIEIPTTIIAGKYDISFPVSQVSLLQNIPDSQLSVFENSGHLPFITEGERFNELIGEIIRHSELEYLEGI